MAKRSETNETGRSSALKNEPCDEFLVRGLQYPAEAIAIEWKRIKVTAIAADQHRVGVQLSQIARRETNHSLKPRFLFRQVCPIRPNCWVQPWTDQL
ncbi:MAG: hypothetical protein AUI45_10445 [Acidobacteria bacterium 13_1_40CM_2_56_11]|nr:MAG: hypothetical protein AUI45_10445 [Acidobacteria bacterium 13_1_40CM_2_56_11]